MLMLSPLPIPLLLSVLPALAAPQESPAPPTPRALNHWTLNVEGVDANVVNRFATDFHALVSKPASSPRRSRWTRRRAS